MDNSAAAKATYEDLRDFILFLHSYAWYREVPYEAAALLIKAGLIERIGKHHFSKSSVCQEIAKHLRDGGDSPELRQILADAGR